MNSSWISTDERLPKNGDHGVCCVHIRDDQSNPLTVVPFSFLNGDFHPYCDDDDMEYEDYWVDPLYWPKFWMPLPPPPK